jgi:hypothetical protein
MRSLWLLLPFLFLQSLAAARPLTRTLCVGLVIFRVSVFVGGLSQTLRCATRFDDRPDGKGTVYWIASSTRVPTRNRKYPRPLHLDSIQAASTRPGQRATGSRMQLVHGPYNARMSCEHGPAPAWHRRALVNRRDVCPANGVTAARSQFNSLVMRQVLVGAGANSESSYSLRTDRIQCEDRYRVR